MRHNCDTIRILTHKNIFSLFQQFYKHITYTEMDQKNRDILQLGFYLLTHEHISRWNDYEHVRGQL